MRIGAGLVVGVPPGVNAVAVPGVVGRPEAVVGREDEGVASLPLCPPPLVK